MVVFNYQLERKISYKSQLLFARSYVAFKASKVLWFYLLTLDVLIVIYNSYV